MSESKQTIVSTFQPPHVSLNGYITGFVTCVALTVAAYFVATNESINHSVAIAVIAVLAVLQCAVQLVKFLHLGDEFKPRLKLTVFILMLSILLIIVIGSLWIMDNLNYRMMQSPRQLNEYIKSQDGL